MEKKMEHCLYWLGVEAVPDLSNTMQPRCNAALVRMRMRMLLHIVMPYRALKVLSDLGQRV